MAAAFNEWMRRYTEEPEKFRQGWQEVVQFLEEKKQGCEEPSYGAECAAYFDSLLREIPFPAEV
jgi:hypothetical protein